MAMAIVGDYEWDEAKNVLNIAKHALGFAEAATIFEGIVFEWRCVRNVEERVVAIGMLAVGKEVVVVYARRHPRRRIISARRAKRHERKNYQDYLRAVDDEA